MGTQEIKQLLGCGNRGIGQGVCPRIANRPSSPLPLSVLVCELPDEPLPACCEHVYSAQMNDQELRKILDDIPKHIVSGLKPVLQAITTTTPQAEIGRAHV